MAAIKMTDEKTAIILFNLGGPDQKSSIKPFLMNFFTDPNIIRVPNPFRYFIARAIAKKRTKKEAGDSYGLLGGGSPLLENSQAQATALENHLNDGKETSTHRVFVCMRYWHPMTPEIVQQVKDYGPDKIILLPLYPQFSTTTTRSSMQQWNKEVKKQGLSVPTKMICCYPCQEGFIKASAESIKPLYETALKKAAEQNLPAPRILFSAHGLPESIIKNGDPYQWQCEQSAEAIVTELAIDNLDWAICYQSRVGPKKWIGPSIDKELQRAAKDNAPVVIYPHSFTQEHVETLVELDIEYKKIAQHLGVPLYYRAKTVGTDKTYIEAMAMMVKNAFKHDDIASDNNTRLCSLDHKECYKTKSCLI